METFGFKQQTETGKIIDSMMPEVNWNALIGTYNNVLQQQDRALISDVLRGSPAVAPNFSADPGARTYLLYLATILENCNSTNYESILLECFWETAHASPKGCNGIIPTFRGICKECEINNLNPADYAPEAYAKLAVRATWSPPVDKRRGGLSVAKMLKKFRILKPAVKKGKVSQAHIHTICEEHFSPSELVRLLTILRSKLPKIWGPQKGLAEQIVRCVENELAARLADVIRQGEESEMEQRAIESTRSILWNEIAQANTDLAGYERQLSEKMPAAETPTGVQRITGRSLLEVFTGALAIKEVIDWVRAVFKKGPQSDQNNDNNRPNDD